MIIPRAAEAASALPEFAPAGPELAVQARDWLAHLTGERRVSPHTAASYARDLRQFLHFAAVHFGKPASLATFTSLTAADLRAFLAARRVRERAAGRLRASSRACGPSRAFSNAMGTARS